MAIYVTREGTKLTADVATELLEKLYQVEPNCCTLYEQFQNHSNSQQETKRVNSENFIAELIQNDYLSVIDPVDG
jgi:hypothetical protein